MHSSSTTMQYLLIPLSLFTLALAADIKDCDTTTCPKRDAASDLVCQSDWATVRKVGMAENVLTLNDTKVSLTLVDGDPRGDISGTDKAMYHTQSLYLGTPADFDVTNQSTGCAIMLQYDFQTFATESSDNKTSCDSLFGASCTKQITSLIKGLKPTGSGKQKCTNLQREVAISITSDRNLCGYYSALVNVTGGQILGTNASKAIDIKTDECNLVLPTSYKLHHVADQELIVPKEKAQNRGGRMGTTPIISVVYSGKDDENPDVQFSCMKVLGEDDQETKKSGAWFVRPPSWVVLLGSVLTFLLM